jgi:hypothetical protein
VIAGLPTPIINYYVGDTLVDSAIVTGDIPETGTLQLMAYNSAYIDSVAITCPPIGGIYGCPVCMESTINALLFPGIVDLANFAWTNDSDLPITKVHKFGRTDAVEFGGDCIWAAAIGEYQGGISSIVAGYEEDGWASPSTTPIIMPSGLKVLVIFNYSWFERVGLSGILPSLQKAYYWEVVSTSPPSYADFDCHDLLNDEIALQHESGYRYDDTYRGNFTASSVAALVYQP